MAARSLPRYNPTLRRHAWHRLREHFRECLWCSIVVENVEPDAEHPQWWKRWTLANGDEGVDYTGARIPSCDGPVWLRLDDGRDVLLAACEAVGVLAAARIRNGQTFAEYPDLERSKDAVLTAHPIADRYPPANPAPGHVGELQLTRAEAYAIGRVAAEAAQQWAGCVTAGDRYVDLIRAAHSTLLQPLITQGVTAS